MRIFYRQPGTEEWFLLSENEFDALAHLPLMLDTVYEIRLESASVRLAELYQFWP